MKLTTEDAASTSVAVGSENGSALAARVETPVKSARPRMIQLDVLRGIAILIVFGRHHPMQLTWTTGRFIRPFVESWFHLGWTGVDLFFVLSGYLIGGLLFEEIHRSERLDVARFLVRRALKIWPGYYLFVGVSIVWYIASAALRGQPFPAEQMQWFVPILLNVQNYFVPPDSAGMYFLHLWSLAVEEHFYLGLPLVLALILNRGSRDQVARFPWIALAVIVFCTTARAVNISQRPFHHATGLFPTHIRMDSLIFGVLLAWVRQFRPAIWSALLRRRGLLFVIGFVLILPFTRLELGGWFGPVFAFNALYVGYGALLIAAVSVPPGKGLVNLALHGRIARGIAFIGFYSYPIYLWHISVGVLPAQMIVDSLPDMETHPTTRWLLMTAIFVPAAIFAGVLIGRLVDHPTLLLRDRLFPPRTIPVEEAPAPANSPADVAPEYQPSSGT